MAWMDVAGGTTLAFPTNPRGGSATGTVIAFSTSPVYTANTVSGTGVDASVVVGMIAAVSDGTTVYYGIVTAVATNLVTVDKWRLYGYPASSGIPAGNVKFYATVTPMFGRGDVSWIIDSIEVRASAAGAVSILDIYGTNTIKTITCIASASPFVFNLTAPHTDKHGDVGFPIESPFLVTTAANIAVTINYRFGGHAG